MTEHSPIESPQPFWPSENDVFADFAESGLAVIGGAIAQVAGDGPSLEEGIAKGLASGIRPFLPVLTDAEQHALSGFLWGAAVSIGRLLESPTPTTQGDSLANT